MFLSYLAKLNGQRLRSSLISANSFARGRPSLQATYSGARQTFQRAMLDR